VKPDGKGEKKVNTKLTAHRVSSEKVYQCVKGGCRIPAGIKFWSLIGQDESGGLYSYNYCDQCAPADAVTESLANDKRDTELATKHGMTLSQLRAAYQDGDQNEGYDDNGKQYDTFEEWLNRKPIKESREPFDGGRGAGMLGVEG